MTGSFCHVEARGNDLFRLACAMDLEGIVAKKADSRYEFNGGRNVSRSPWKKIKNPAYSQKNGREELFERPRKIKRPEQPTPSSAKVAGLVHSERRGQ